jgi:hypothetical protein
MVLVGLEPHTTLSNVTFSHPNLMISREKHRNLEKLY